jgi:hypothetical protein
VAAAAAVAGLPWLLAWAFAVVSVAVAVVWWWRGQTGGELSPAQASGAHAFAAATGRGLAVLSLFLHRVNADDVFYVGRATATGQLGHIPVRDVIFTAEKAERSGGTGLPLDSFSALMGAMGRAADVHPASVAYYVMPPLMTFLATWALWRLVRSWAPRRVVMCFVLGITFWLWSAQAIDTPPFTGKITPGNFFISRMWQGKVVFFAWLIPMIYVYLTRWLDRRDRPTAVLILASVIAGIGLTSSASFILPLVFGAAAFPLAVGRHWRALGLVVFAGGLPLAVGVIAANRFPLSSSFAGEPAEWYHKSYFGAGLVAFIATLAVFVAPWLARPGPPRSVTLTIAGILVVLLAPDVLAAVNKLAGHSVTGALRRTLWVAPLPALVGLLAAVPSGEVARRGVAGAPRLSSPRIGWVAWAVVPACIAALLIAFGHPLWSDPNGLSRLTTRPTWKTSTQTLATTRAILERYEGTGPILASPPIMATIPLLTVEPKAVNARSLYLRRTQLPPEALRERLALTGVAMDGRAVLSRRRISKALSDIGVGLVCLPRDHREQLERIQETGFFHPGFETHGYACLER